MSDFEFDLYVKKVNELDSKLDEIVKLVSETKKDLAVGNIIVVKENVSKLQELVALDEQVDALLPKEKGNQGVDDLKPLDPNIIKNEQF